MARDTKPTRSSIFQEASKKLRQEFETLVSLPHMGEKGKEAENILKKFLEGHLPKRFGICSGFILDRDDNVSRQTDVIVYDSNNCPVLETFEDNLIIPHDNTAAIIEVKSNLTYKDIIDAADKIAHVKSLIKSKVSLPLSGPWNISTIGILFAFKSTLSLETISKHYHSAIAEHGLGKHIDYIFVLDEGMCSISAHFPGEPGFSPVLMLSPDFAIPGTVLIAAGTKLKEKTLDSFLRFLLAHLQFYYPWIAHPGFDMKPSETAKGEKVFGRFLTVWLEEKDEEKKKKLKEEYKRKFLEGKLG